MAMENDLTILRCETTQEIEREILGYFYQGSTLLPRSKDARVLVKPNFNSNMNALTGNVTDLRLLVAVIQTLKNLGYSNITIGEGTSSGYYRKGVDIFARLGVDRLAKRYGVKMMDFNYDRAVPIDFEDGVKAGVAETCLNADFFINIPKLKTHHETEMTVCLKSLMGCLVGMENKRKTHWSLVKNIYNLNRYVKPDLHIVDAVIAMEGTGPTTGEPIKLGAVLIGTDPFLVDLACARLADIPFHEVPLLRLGEEMGDVTDNFHKYLDDIGLDRFKKSFKRPQVGWLTALVTHKKLQKYFLKIRHAPGIRAVFNSSFGNRLLFAVHLTQEILSLEEREDNVLSLDGEKCEECQKCRDYCPMGLDLPYDLAGEGCINCLYCYCVCPNRAIEIEGDLGYFSEQVRQYDGLVRSIA